MNMRNPYASGIPGSHSIPRSGGMIRSTVPGRTDRIPLRVGSGSFILPSDIVGAIGQNNSDAGAQIIGSMFGLGTHGAPRGGYADGGGVDEEVPIVAAGGEVVIPASVVKEIGHGSLSAGHKVLHRFCLKVRREHIRELRKLKDPKQ